MIPLIALDGVSMGVDALSSGASWLSKQLSSSAPDTDSNGKPINTGTSDPTSFASILAAQGTGAAATTSATPVGAATVPTTPTVSAAGHIGSSSHAISSGAQRVGHFS